MSYRKSILVFVSILLLAAVVSLVVIGLALGTADRRVTARPADLGIATPRQRFGTPFAYTILTAEATPLADGAGTPAATPFASEVPGQETPPPVGQTPAVGGGTAAATPGPWPSLAASPALSGTPWPTAALTTTASATPTPTGTPTVTGTPLALARISGRVLLGGAPAGAGVKLRLEDQDYERVAETSTAADGGYVFADLQPSEQVYSVVFAQEWNPQFAVSQVVSWAWVGPVSVASSTGVELPDFDIALAGFGQARPAPNATYSAAAISAQSPILFEWSAYPQADAYWVDLARGEAQELVWQSARVPATSLAFDGTLRNGSHIQPGEYWWGVGARRALDSYRLAVYGYLPVFLVEP